MPSAVRVHRHEHQTEPAMAKTATKWLIIVSVVIGFSASGWAQDAGKTELSKSNTPFSTRWEQANDVGEVEYLTSCSACHGLDGRGDGPLRGELKSKPADLTVLAKKNNGVFPLNAIYETIDGRKSVSAHGTSEMPIWGFRYMPSPNQALGPAAADKYLNLSYNPDFAVRNRVLALVDFLNRIQEK